MFNLPPPNHPARELMGDMAHLAGILNPANAAKLSPVWKARKAALAMFEGDTTGAMRRVALVVVRVDTDQKWLVTFGPKGGWRKEWNFGTGYAGSPPPRYTVEIKINPEHAAAAQAAVSAKTISC